MEPHTDLRLALLNPWQRGFPLVREPFAHIASTLGMSADEVLAGYARLQQDGALSRIGGVFAGNAGGAALLAAMAVPPERLDAVAAVVSSHPGVNHNYQREHHYNLWFVMTGQDDAAVRAAMQSLEDATGLMALQLRMQRAYRIDLGFDLRERTAPAPMAAAREATPVLDADRPLAALQRRPSAVATALRQLGAGAGPHARVRAADAAAVAGRRHAAAHRRHRAPPRAGLRRQRHDGVQHPRSAGGCLRRGPRPCDRRDAGLPARARWGLALQPVLHGAWPRPGRRTGRDRARHRRRGPGAVPARGAVFLPPLQADRPPALPRPARSRCPQRRHTGGARCCRRMTPACSSACTAICR